jgi:hypothetical protein
VARRARGSSGRRRGWGGNQIARRVQPFGALLSHPILWKSNLAPQPLKSKLLSQISPFTLHPQSQTLRVNPKAHKYTYTLNQMRHTLYPLSQPYTLHPISLRIYPVPYTLYPIPFTLYLIPYTLYHIPLPHNKYHIPYTLYPILYTIYHIPYTIYHIPYTLYPILYTIYPKSQSLYLVPYTR